MRRGAEMGKTNEHIVFMGSILLTLLWTFHPLLVWVAETNILIRILVAMLAYYVDIFL
jgi:hypothetical protein